MKNNSEKNREKSDPTKVRKDLQDGAKGKDLSYLNEMPQMSGYEGVKAGVPPPAGQDPDEEKDMADES